MFDSSNFLKTVTACPGVYCMYDKAGQILYVGKAKNLKKRLQSYFRVQTETRIQHLVSRIHNIETTVTQNEKEALLLENSLIKHLGPKYNIILKDDKSYPYLFISKHPYPRLIYYRGHQQIKGDYFGPYSSAAAVREAINYLQRVFKIRHCRDSFFNHRSRPCLQYQIKRCSAPCVGLINEVDYLEDVKKLKDFLRGKNLNLQSKLIEQMTQASENLEFEKAAEIRDQVKSLREIQEQQGVISNQGQADIVAIVNEGDQIGISVLSVRGGKVLGAKNYFPKVGGETDLGVILSAFLSQYYIRSQLQHDFPNEIIVNHHLRDRTLLEEVLTELIGRSISIKSQVRTQRAQWLEIAISNAKEAILSRMSSKMHQGKRVTELEQTLNLEINRFACVDASHTFGEAAVVSWVMFDRHGPVKADYRRYNVAANDGDDYAALEEALSRHFIRVKKDNYPTPDVLFIDGGKGQLQRARKVLEECQVTDVLLVGIAKGIGRKPGLETLFIYQSETSHLEEVHLSPMSPALHLIQSIRDEAHRFAITAHRKRRAKKRNTSPLESIAGVGPKRRQQLLNHFGGLQALTGASMSAIASLPGINKGLAQRIYEALHSNNTQQR